jgi:hypothetical protein
LIGLKEVMQESDYNPMPETLEIKGAGASRDKTDN